MYAGYESLRFEREGAVLTIKICNPGSRNAIDERLHEELGRVFSDVARDRACRVVVLTGDPSGDAFCAGGDARWLLDAGSDISRIERMLQDGRNIVRGLLELPQPAIALINGHAIGLGATLALHCDLSYMDESARIADPHVRFGVVAGDGGAVIWPFLIGPNRAKEFLMTGDAICARDAAAMGLVNHVLPAHQLKQACYEMARRLAEGPRLAIEWTKRSVNLVLQQQCAVLSASMAFEGMTFASPDHREALRAFLAKEPPKFGQANSQAGDVTCP